MRDKEFAQKVIWKIYENNISLKQSEKILIFTDDCKRCDNINAGNDLFEIALLFTETAKNFTKNVNFTYYPSLCGHGKEPPEELWRTTFGENAVKELKKINLLKKLLEKKLTIDEIEKVKHLLKEYSENIPDVIIALPYYSTSHTLFRKILTDIFKSRYCSMPLFEESMFYSALQEDFFIIKKRAEILKDKLKDTDTIIVKSENGTYLRFSVKNRKFILDTGDLSYPGSFSNLPAGEVFVAPVEDTADGKIVIEFEPTQKLNSPLTLWLNEGKVVHIEGKDNYKQILNAKFSKDENNKRLAEFGIGINSQASNMFNILEAEKIYGTIHFAFGDNSSFGGKIKTNFHEDYLIEKPTVELFKKDGTNLKIIEKGVPIF